ncbi:restriction endonuclease subunit S [Enterococcus faecium]|uniref:restriction endonuclease subunit S n=1 Tax=Enterococcus faecium TaxID=1352 RepID=UPI0021E81BB3|nr:restriction endonuclease subunit S [Enterococcus faecium]MCV3175554.1 restriction endonuclease subunit S [Enterococcus faecium]
MSNNTQPEIRFPGFTEDWEQRKLGDFIDVKSGKDYKHLNSGSIPVYGTGGYMLSVDRALSDIDAIGIGRKGTIDKPYLLKAPFWTVDTLFYAVPKQNIDLQFSLSIFKKINWKKFDESTGVPSLSKTVINSVGASVPSYEEQQKIGSFFKQLDDTIALHQRKLDLLKETKKGFLQKMFPKNGAKVPEIRFPGFTGDWEQRKLGDVLTVSKEKNKSNSYSKEQILSVSREVGTVNQIEYQGRSFAGADISGYKIVYPGQLIYTKSPLKGAPYGIFQLVTEEGIVSPLYAVYNSTEQALASFIGLQLKSDNIATHYLSPLVSKGAKNTINITDEGALDGRVTYPTITEQQKIGTFFQQLDDTIALHQRKLDLLKETKKGFLQKMFV